MAINFQKLTQAFADFVQEVKEDLAGTIPASAPAAVAAPAATPAAPAPAAEAAPAAVTAAAPAPVAAKAPAPAAPLTGNDAIKARIAARKALETPPAKPAVVTQVGKAKPLPHMIMPGLVKTQVPGK